MHEFQQGYKPNKFLLSVDELTTEIYVIDGYKPNKFLLSVDYKVVDSLFHGL